MKKGFFGVGLLHVIDAAIVCLIVGLLLMGSFPVTVGCKTQNAQPPTVRLFPPNRGPYPEDELINSDPERVHQVPILEIQPGN